MTDLVEIFYTSKFAREYKKLSPAVKNHAEELEKIFRRNPFDSRLKTHKLNGRLREFLSFFIGHKHRIIFELSADRRTAFFHSVGDHDIYQ